jgi:CRISPR-associated protein Csm1
MSHTLINPSCRVALAAYLHDLGKFAERAGAFDTDPRLDAHLTLYCPMGRAGDNRWFTHRHAAHTALAFDLIEKHLPQLLGSDPSPFVGRVRAGDPGGLEPTDSLVNAAAAHHKPDTFLQWIVATADRIASGFEREEFDQYNAAKDETRDGLNHITARSLTLFEQLRVDGPSGSEATLHYRYPLLPLAPETIFPIEARRCETRDRERARQDYRTLWDGFISGLETIPRSHRSNWPLWLDHFDSLWLVFTHAIPAATAFNIKPEVSLYDHSRTTAALAVALWRWHAERGQTDSTAALAMRERTDYAIQKLLMVQGDFFGIQNFLFAAGGETRKQAAKLLRGRSFQVSLFTELAALRLLDELDLPPTSQVLNAAGKFLIVAPNTDETRESLIRVRRAFDQWFLDHTFGLAGMGIAWEPASCSDLLKGRQGESPYGRLLERLHRSLETAKHRRFDLCTRDAPSFAHADFQHGVCGYDGRLPADQAASGEKPPSCQLSRDQIRIGEALLRFDRLLILGRQAAQMLHEGADLTRLELDLFGYSAAFTGDQAASGQFGRLAETGALCRCWDFSTPKPEDDSAETVLWNGYARRFISGYVPRVSAADLISNARYGPLDEPPDLHGLKTLDMLACEDRLSKNGKWLGIASLGVVKGDIDDLGELFRVGLGSPTFAKSAALSRQINGFFAIYLPQLLAREFPNVYTVFAGGDDFFLIGPWRTAQKLAARMRSDFARYAAENSGAHFSVGITTQKPGAPIGALAELAEQALAAAKKHPGKNAVTCFGETVPWSNWPELERSLTRLEQLNSEATLSSGYLYRLLQFVSMRQREKSGQADGAIWRARFQYLTRRYVVDKKAGLDESGRQQLFGRLAEAIGSAIESFGSSYRIPLFNYFYLNRER